MSDLQGQMRPHDSDLSKMRDPRHSIQGPRSSNFDPDHRLVLLSPGAVDQTGETESWK
ncbi:hypothetical protein CIHG_05326 [Coccidioides immitis H538.4]|uniref:Uncharacterized protein n=1 Tax=Coccidioides immitis H538.4 TaxID=396776 RepID=A0A0J8RSI5_COCIT|nr:hypothetical protein CIHG_05326 [Coccidioides immitis H538.4]